MTAARVLVVEDEPVLREAVAAALEAAGFVVLAAADGRDLDAAVARFRPDAAVLDISLPGPDGLALARRLRELGEVAVVFVTARDAVPTGWPASPPARTTTWSSRSCWPSWWPGCGRCCGGPAGCGRRPWRWASSCWTRTRAGCWWPASRSRSRRPSSGCCPTWSATGAGCCPRRRS